MTDDFVKIFIDFLKENNCLDQYKNNVKSFHVNDLIFFRNIFNQDPKGYVTSPFLWVGSPEGPDFWKDINQKWKSELKRGNYDRYGVRVI